MSSNMQISWLSLLFLLSCRVLALRATCNVCNPVNRMSCYSVNQMQACNAYNLPSGLPYHCPSGYVCVSSRTQGVLCAPQDSPGTWPACQECNKCDISNTFACTGPNSFSLCLGSGRPQNSWGTCSEGYVCNVNHAYICGSPAKGISPSCLTEDHTTTTTTTTMAPPPSTSNPASYCAYVQSQGKYPVGFNPQSSCRQYIHCFLLNGNWHGNRYTCPGHTYFDSSANLCVDSLPAKCAAYVDPTTTTTTPRPTTSNPAAYCKAMQAQDHFPVGFDPHTTCRQYIYCFLLNGSWRGQKYTCPGDMYYNSSSKRCVEELPATCSHTVASLSLNGVDLE